MVNSSELRAVQGHQKNDFVLRLINPPVLREKSVRGKKKAADAQQQPVEVEYGPHQKWGLDPDIDKDTRKVFFGLVERALEFGGDCKRCEGCYLGASGV